MKKPSKKKRVPPRRKPLRKDRGRGRGFVLPWQPSPDRGEAIRRATLERMPPEVQEEWQRLRKLLRSEDGELDDPADQARLDEILDQYEDPVTDEDIARHVADIVREREARGAVSEP